MPRYDYRCRAGHEYERQEPFGSPSEHACEVCGKPAQRLLTPPTVIFKGGGFYKTSGRGGVDTSSGTSSDDDAKKKPTADEKNAADSSAPSPSQSHSTAPAAED